MSWRQHCCITNRPTKGGYRRQKVFSRGSGSNPGPEICKNIRVFNLCCFLSMLLDVLGVKRVQQSYIKPGTFITDHLGNGKHILDACLRVHILDMFMLCHAPAWKHPPCPWSNTHLGPWPSSHLAAWQHRWLHCMTLSKANLARLSCLHQSMFTLVDANQIHTYP